MKKKYKFKKQKVQYTERKPFLADKEIIFRSSGRAKVFNISHRLQVCFLTVLTAALCWSGYSSYAYHNSKSILNKTDRELDQARDAYVDLMTDVSALQHNLNEVIASVEDAGNGLNEVQNYKNKASMMESKIRLITNSQSWIDADKINDTVSKKEALIQKDVAIIQKNIALKENNDLKEKILNLSQTLSDLQHTVKGLETAEIVILDKIEKMSGKEIEEIKTSLGMINQSLKKQKQYFNPLANMKDGKGGAYKPLKGVKIGDELQDKMSSAFAKIDLLDAYKTSLSALPLGKPVYKYRFSSSFGNRSDPIETRIAQHKGVDLSAAVGSRVSAPAAGKIIYAGFNNGGYGNLVEISHGNGFVTKYAHLNKIYVKKGDFVAYNQAIGEVGRTGRATGSHLHYEVLYNGKNVNPLTFINIPSMNKS